MKVAKLSDVVHDWKIFYSNKNFRKDVLIRLILINRNFICNFIQLRKNNFRLHTNPHSDDWEGFFYMVVANVK